MLLYQVTAHFMFGDEEMSANLDLKTLESFKKMKWDLFLLFQRKTQSIMLSRSLLEKLIQW